VPSREADQRSLLPCRRAVAAAEVEIAACLFHLPLGLHVALALWAHLMCGLAEGDNGGSVATTRALTRPLTWCSVPPVLALQYPCGLLHV